MDRTETYIKMNTKAVEIQIAKFRGEGLVAGDCVWNGIQVLYLGNDFFGLSGLWQDKVPYAYIASMEETPPVVFTQDRLMDTVTMRLRHDKYDGPDVDCVY